MKKKKKEKKELKAHVWPPSPFPPLQADPEYADALDALRRDNEPADDPLLGNLQELAGAFGDLGGGARDGPLAGMAGLLGDLGVKDSDLDKVNGPSPGCLYRRMTESIVFGWPHVNHCESMFFTSTEQSLMSVD